MKFSSLARLLFAILFIGIFMSSCRAPKDLVFKEYRNLSIDKMGFSQSSLKVDLVYYNPNNFGLELNRTDLDVYVDSTFLGHSTQNLQIKIPSRQDFVIPLNVDLDMKNLLKNSFNSLFGKEVLIRLVGNIKLGKMGVYKNFKVDYSTKKSFSMF